MYKFPNRTVEVEPFELASSNSTLEMSRSSFFGVQNTEEFASFCDKHNLYPIRSEKVGFGIPSESDDNKWLYGFGSKGLLPNPESPTEISAAEEFYRSLSYHIIGNYNIVIMCTKIRLRPFELDESYSIVVNPQGNTKVLDINSIYDIAASRTGYKENVTTACEG